MFHEYGASNGRKGVIANLIHVPSRFLYSEMMTSKSAASEWLVKKVRELMDVDAPLHKYPVVIRVDAGVEWSVNKLHSLEKMGVEVVRVNKSSRTDLRGVGSMAMIERANGTIRALIEKYITLTEDTKFVDVFDEIIEQYNSHKNAYGWAPKALEELKPAAVRAYEKHEAERLTASEKFRDRVIKKFPIGSRVRLRKYRGVFVKGAKPTFENTIWTVKSHSGYSVIVKRGDETKRKLYYELAIVGKNEKGLDDGEKGEDKYKDFEKAKKAEKAEDDNTPKRPRAQVEKVNKIKRTNARDFKVGDEVEGVNDEGVPKYKKRLTPASTKRAMKAPAKYDL
jgi:hypothetical protein